MKMLELIQEINKSEIPKGQSHSDAQMDAFKYATMLYERLSKGKDSSVLNEMQDIEAASDALAYLLWQQIRLGVPR
jgi:hypothetical protein